VFGGGGTGGGGREVAGPYRSQSSIPSIRAKATPYEHRKVNPLDQLDRHVQRGFAAFHVTPLGTALAKAAQHSAPAPIAIADLTSLLRPPPERFEDPLSAYDNARFHGIQPPASLRAAYHRDYGPGVYGQILNAAVRQIGSHENLGQPADLTNLILGAATLGGGLYLKGALSGAEAGAGALGGADAGETAASGGKLAAGLRLGGRALTAPIRHPFITGGSPLLAQAPAAAFHGNPGELGKALQGTGVEAQILGDAGSAVAKAVPGVAGNALRDALSLPSQVLPSTYLTGKAAVNAIGGHPEELAALRKGFQDTSALAALLYQGDPAEALRRTGEHPLYTALEALALKSAAGQGAGALLRRLGGARGREIAGVAQRPPLSVYGDVGINRGQYSGDLLSRALQKASDARRQVGPHGELLAKPGEIRRHLASALDREVYAGEQVRRGNQRRVTHEVEQGRPADASQADVASLAIQGIARDPARAVADLRTYREHLVEVQPKLTASELETNRQMIGVLDSALANPNPEAIFHAAENFIRVQKPINDALVAKGLLSDTQARKAIAIPYARTHMGADYGLSRNDTAMLEQIKGEMAQSGLSAQERGQLLGRYSRVSSRRQTLDASGQALSLDAIEAHMNTAGVGARGFVTQRLPQATGPSSFYSPPNERPSLRSQRRTGEATTQGTFDPKWEAVVQQAVHGQTVLDRVHNFERIVDRFGLRGPAGRSFANYSEAKRAAEHPADFNMRLPEIPGGWTPIRTSPWLAKKAEVEASHDLGATTALEADHPSVIENFSADALKNALTPGDGPTILIPKAIADRMRQHFQEQLPLEKAAQAVTGAFKGAVLPTSPGWIAGNVLDNYVIRAFGTGLGPREMRTGRNFAEMVKGNLPPEQAARALESIVPGGLYGSYARIQPYRALEQFVGTRVERFARAAHAVLTTPGVRTVANLYRNYRDTVFELDGKFVETFPQYGQLAKSARKELGLTRRQFRQAVASQEPVLADLARGFRDPEKVDRYAKDVEAVFGNWGKSSPEARRFLTTWSPFWQWARNSFKFAFVTLPRDHPVLTGLIAASEQMTRAERQKLGFDLEGKEPLPDFLQTGIPDPFHTGGAVKLSNLTTFGTFADWPRFLAQIPAPQFASLILGGFGLDWKGDKLVRKDGSPARAPEKIKVAVLGTLEAYLPFLNVARQVAGHGAGGLSPLRTYPPSTVGFLREPKQQINVPVSGGSSSGNPLDQLDGQLEGGGNPLDQLDKQLEGLP